MNYSDKYKEYVDSFETFLKKYFNSLSGVEPGILEAVKYSLFSGGKRVRPVIMLAVYELCGGKEKEIYNFAAAIEMIHTYSLIHDDLPCMDNDFIRRGKPCNHVVYGENMALLAGDALLTCAFEVASDALSGRVSSEKILKSINILSKYAGMAGMISGQCFDLKWDCKSKSKDELLKIYTLKTAKLIAASAKIGAILSGASDEKVNLAEKFGENIGICFQLVDDIIDKETGNLSLFESPEKLVHMLTHNAKKNLELIGGNTGFLNEFVDKLMVRKK